MKVILYRNRLSKVVLFYIKKFKNLEENRKTRRKFSNIFVNFKTICNDDLKLFSQLDLE